MGTQGLPYVIDLLDFTPRYPFVRRPMPLIERRIAHFPRIVSDTIFFIITYFYRLFGVYPFSKGISGVFSSASRKSVIKKGGVRRIQENSGESRGIQENPGEFRGIQENSGESTELTQKSYQKLGTHHSFIRSASSSALSTSCSGLLLTLSFCSSVIAVLLML